MRCEQEREANFMVGTGSSTQDLAPSTREKPGTLNILEL